MKKSILLSFFIGMISTFYAQELLPLSVRQKEELKETSWVREVPFEKIADSEIGNSVVAFSVHPTDASEILVSPSGGGLWHTTNGGETFVSLFDNGPTQQIDALAVLWEQRLIWIGTPYGLFYSEDFGKTWLFGGLSSVKQITSIYINPRNKADVLVGVLGDIYQSDEKRGIFRTTNNGITWQQRLFVGTRTGVSQIVSSSGKVIYAVAWQVEGTPWESTYYGKQSAVYKSTDNGNTWSKTSNANGFLSGDYVGKIGLAVYDDNTVYAVVDNRQAVVLQNNSNSVEKVQHIYLSSKEIASMNKAEFLALDDNKLEVYLHTQGLEQKYSAQNLKNMVRSGVVLPSHLMDYLGLPSKEIVGAEVYLTTDAGKSWKKTHNHLLPDVYYHQGNLFGAIAVNPNNKNEVFIGGYPLLKSGDGGKTWRNATSISLDNKHTSVFIHANGQIFTSDKYGLKISYSGGNKWISKKIGEASNFESVVYNATDKALFVAGKNGSWVYKNNQWKEIEPSTNQVVSTKNNTYVAGNLGYFRRYNTGQDITSSLGTLYTSDDTLPLRFGMFSPMEISMQNPDILYVGSNKLHISLNKGGHWRNISEDLTNGDKKGNKAYGTLSSIAESPFLFGLIYTGSDDGMVHVSKNGGVSWQLIYNAFPQPLSVSQILASRHQRSRVLVILKNIAPYELEPFVFISEDYGKTWQNLRTNLPSGRCNVLREDPRNEQILYLGTQSGLYVSFDFGESWQPFSKNLPEVEISDIYIDEKTSEMIVATSGRGIYKTSIKYIQQLRAAILTQDFYPLEEQYRIKHTAEWGNIWNQWSEPVRPSITLVAFSGKKETQNLTIKIMKEDVVLQQFSRPTIQGFNYIDYDLTISEAGKLAYEKKKQKMMLTKAVDGNVYLPKGIYNISFTTDEMEEIRELVVE